MKMYVVQWWAGTIGWLPDSLHVFEWTARRALGKRVTTDTRTRRWRVVEGKRVPVGDHSTRIAERVVVECHRMTPRTRRPKAEAVPS